MKSSPAGLSLIALGFLLGSSSVVAHHGDAGRYDETPVTLSGTVVSLQLMNPHSLLIVDVEDEHGGVVRWRAEFGSPQILVNVYGWDRNTLKPGDKITMTGRRVLNGAPYFNLTEQAAVVMTETGEQIYRNQ